MSVPEARPPAGTDDLRVADVTAALRRRWRVLTAILLLGGGLAAASTTVIAPSASAEATVLLEATTVDVVETTDTALDRVDVTLEARRLRSSSVLDVAAARLADIDGEALREALTVRAVPDTTLLSVEVSARRADQAADRLDAVIDTFLSDRQQRAEDALAARRSTLESQIDALSGQLDAIEDRIVEAATAEDQAQQSILESRRDTLLGRLDDRTADMARIDLLSTHPGSVIDGPRTDDAAAPSPAIVGGGVFALFVLLGIVAALVRDRTDDRIWDSTDIERFLPDTPVLLIDADQVAPDQLLGGPVFREVRDLVISFPVPGSITLVVTAVNEDDTTPLVSAGIGSAMRRAGLDVVVLDPVGAPGMGTAIERFGAPERADGGLAAFLDGHATLADAAVEASEQPGLRFLRTREPRSTDDLTVAPRLRQLLWSRGQESDETSTSGVSVVVSAPSVVDAPDGAAFAGMGDAVILMIRRRGTTRTHLRQALRSLRTHAAPIAVVLALPEP